MRILFLQQVAFEYVGVMCLSAYVKSKGHECDILIESEEGKSFWPKALAYKPDAIAFSAMTGFHSHYLKVAEEAKKRMKVPVIFGGPHPTFFPEMVEHPAVDAVCRGEGEEALVDFLNALQDGGDFSHIPNLWVKKDDAVLRNEVRCGENELDNYPPADREIYYKYRYLREYPAKPFITGRGCPYLCTFCFNRDFNQMYKGKMKVLRRISPEKVIEEIRDCRQRYPLRKIFFNDDIFIMQKDWLEEFVPLYNKEIGLPYACNVRANLAKEEIVKLLKESGCTLVMWGIESGNEKRRREILGKNISDEQIRSAASLFRKYGIKMKSFNIMGSPGETLEEAVETIKLNAEVKIDYPWCSILQPYPHTVIAEIAQEKGVLKTDYSLDDMEKSFFSKSILNQADIERIERLQKLFYMGVKLPVLIPFFKWLTKFRLGAIFQLLFGVSFLYRFMRETDIPLHQVVIFALRHRKSY
jgi:radical SAM superfamily enzyme YgiQ (UPF0313 family)